MPTEITDLDHMLIRRRSTARELVPLDSPTTAVGANSTTIATGISIGFTFRLDGVDYTTCALAPQGFMRLAGTETSSDNTRLFATNTNVILAPWWDDLETAVTVGYIKHETQGTAPWRTFIAEWYVNFQSSYDGTDYARAKMQVVLYESKNRVEFRYGTRETGGSPTNSGSASIGIKADTSGTATNYRDCAAPSGTPVDNLTLGGATSTTTANLRHYSATEWPGDTTNGWMLVIEPNWPMVGFYIDVSDDDITGVQDEECEVLWRIANNVNWLYCKHTPPLINASPWCPVSATIANPIHVYPVTPSADGLNYDVWIESYSADGTTTLDVGEDDAADPQPATDADWSSLATPSDPASSGTQSWGVFQIQPDTGTEQIRFKFTDGDHKVMSIMVAPAELDGFDPTLSYASGFQPMGIGQIRQSGAAIHPEFPNRAWRNVARILSDRKQALWSLSSGVSSDYELDAATYPIHTAGVAPCSLSGWLGQEVTVKVLAYDDDDGALCVVGERGGSAVTFDVDSNGDEYRLQTDTLTLLGDAPVIYAQIDPSTASYLHAVVVEWAPALVDEDYIRETTPAPRLEMLGALVERVRRACLYSYAMTGLATMMRRGASNEWRMAWMVPPSTKALRPMVARHASPTSKGQPQDTSIYGTTSGSGGSDEILIPSPHADARDAYPPDGGQIAVVAGSLRFDASPGAAGDRLLESPTADSPLGAVREMCRVTYGVGMTLVPIPDDPEA